MYRETVPVFRHYLGKISEIVEKTGSASPWPDALTTRIADSFPAGQHFATAAGFALRTTCPLCGREIPNLPQSLAARLAVVRATLGAMKPAEFDGSEELVIRHTAGFAELEQTGRDFALLFGLPNFFFHMTMGYASLRAAGVPLGKGDFDGLHGYPADFHFD